MSQLRTRPLRFAWGTVVYHLMRADLFERARRYSFLITLGSVVFAAYLYIPPKEADYLTLGLGNYRGVYNSAWIGSAVAVLSSALLSLPAFYLVKNAVERDERTRVGQIVATTPLSKPLYTLGKAFSNFVFLAVMVGVIALAAAGMQLIRGESLRLDPWALLSPFVLCSLPAALHLSACRQTEHGNLGSAVDASGRGDEPYAPVDVDGRAWPNHQPAGVLLAEDGWHEKGTEKRQSHLPSMGMPTQSQVNAALWHHLGEVWVVYQQQARATGWDCVQYLTQILGSRLPGHREVAEGSTRIAGILDAQ